MSTPTIKPIAPHDLPLVLDIERRSHSHPWTQKNFEDALLAGYLGLALWQEDTLLGFAWFMRALDEAELLDIAIAPDFRRQGHADTLLAYAYEKLARTGCAAVHLEVRASNVNARALYAQQGFAEVGLRPGYYPLGHAREDAILMKKALHAYA
jgi:[ribosomal protein S18]-alanine N-acetyltransferase